MALRDLTSRDAVLEAIGEFDRLGQDPFLEKYGFGRARDYFVIHEGKAYDSKAIAGAAHMLQTGTPLSSAEFSGGENTVAAKLEALGFVVSRPRSAPWHTAVGAITTRAEIVSLYGGASQGGIEPSRTTDNVILYTDPSAGSQHGYNFDGWDEEDPSVFYFTGDGQTGPQTFVGGNKSVLDAADAGRTLRLFEAVDGRRRAGGKLQRYLGAFHLDQANRIGTSRRSAPMVRQDRSSSFGLSLMAMLPL